MAGLEIAAIVTLLFGCAAAGVARLLTWHANKPQYISPDYKIKFYWYQIKPIEDLVKVDGAIGYLVQEFRQEYPGIKLVDLIKALSYIKVRVCHDWDNEVYEGKCLVESTHKKHMIYLRRTNPSILKTAFLHEVIHCLVDHFTIIPGGDPTHGIPRLWEGKGILGTVKKKMGV